LADPPVAGEASVIAGIDMETGEILDSRG
jgi:hypothetical protein